MAVLHSALLVCSVENMAPSFEIDFKNGDKKKLIPTKEKNLGLYTIKLPNASWRR